MKLILAAFGLFGLYHLVAAHGSAGAAGVLTAGAATALLVIAGLMRDA
jgi:hypothetical protein